MDPCVVVSPHLDDAALSVGQFLLSWPGAYVLTLFCGLPSEPRVTTFDVNCGFTDSTDALVGRAHEDDRAMQVLGARQIRAPFLDNQYRREDDSQHRALRAVLASAIEKTVQTLGANRLLGPLGLLHPDHVFASNATLDAAEALGCRLWLYEEIPSRVVDPEAVVARINAIGRPLALDHLGTGDLALKRRAVECYKSQLWALDPNLLYVPERIRQVV